MKTGCLHQAFQAIPEPRFDAADEKQLFEDMDVFLRRFIVEMVLSADLGEVCQLSRMMDEYPKQSGHAIETLHVGDVAHVASHECIDVVTRAHACRRAGVFRRSISG
jgi:hypothetical protein